VNVLHGSRDVVRWFGEDERDLGIE
jgi:hypothetical protein